MLEKMIEELIWHRHQALTIHDQSFVWFTESPQMWVDKFPVREGVHRKNIPRIGKLPYGAKWGFIERKALLKERIYLKKGLSETNSKIVKSVQNYEIWAKLWNMVEIVKSGQNCEIRSKSWNLVKIVKFGKNCEIWSKLWNLVKIVKSGQNCEIWSKL